MYNYIIKQYSTLLDFLSKNEKRKRKRRKKSRFTEDLSFAGTDIYCYYVIIGIPKFSIIQFFSISSQKNNYHVVQNLAQDKKQKIGMKLGWVVTCTTHCLGQFFLLLSKFLVCLLASLVHGTCLCLRSMKQGDCSLISIKLGSIGPSLGRITSCSFRIRLLIWHTLLIVHTFTPANPFLFY